ncbi:hypothetical protein KY284_016933 [Solanum tuberosum]|nr:hypothetical protein KY284_016933 [Solanum tuberosum]
MAMPKHRFMTWLAVQGRLLTHERKLRLQIQVEDTACCLCEGKVMETNVHHFEDCKWTSAVWQAMHQWTEVPVHNIGIVQLSAEQSFTTLGVLGIGGDLETYVYIQKRQ